MNNLREAENKGIGNLTIVLITDNHKKHILSHLKYIRKPRIFKHIILHLIRWYQKKKKGLPTIELSDILKKYDK